MGSRQQQMTNGESQIAGPRRAPYGAGRDCFVAALLAMTRRCRGWTIQPRPDQGPAVSDKANRRARGAGDWGLPVSDWGFEDAKKGTQFATGRCQTNPICGTRWVRAEDPRMSNKANFAVLGVKMEVGLKNKRNSARISPLRPAFSGPPVEMTEGAALRSKRHRGMDPAGPNKANFGFGGPDTREPGAKCAKQSQFRGPVGREPGT